MSQPIVVNLPHNLGTEEAKRRMQGGIGKLQDHIPGGADVSHSWEGDRMNLAVRALGQEVDAKMDVSERNVRLEFTLPAFFALFGRKIEGLLQQKGGELLEDKSERKSG